MTAVGVLAAAAKRAVRSASSVWLSSACNQPRSPACGAVAGVRRDDLGHVVPGLAALEVAQRLIGLGLGGRLLGLGRLGRAGAHLWGDLDHPGVALLGRGRFLGELSVDVGIGDDDALGRRKVRLDPVVDEPLQRHRLDLLLLLLDDLRLLVAAWAWVRWPAASSVRMSRPGFGQAPVLDQAAVHPLVAGDRLPGHAADRREVVVVVGQADRDHEDQQGRHHDQAEAEIEQGVPSVMALP